MHLSIFYRLFVPLEPLQHMICSLGNNRLLLIELYISFIIAFRIVQIISKHMIGLYLLGIVPFVRGTFCIKEVFPFVIHVKILASCRNLVSRGANLPRVDMYLLNQNPCIHHGLEPSNLLLS